MKASPHKLNYQNTFLIHYGKLYPWYHCENIFPSQALIIIYLHSSHSTITTLATLLHSFNYPNLNTDFTPCFDHIFFPNMITNITASILKAYIRSSLEYSSSKCHITNKTSWIRYWKRIHYLKTRTYSYHQIPLQNKGVFFSSSFFSLSHLGVISYKGHNVGIMRIGFMHIQYIDIFFIVFYI